MPTKFQEKWFEAVETKNSVLCAGLDPAEFGMGRGDGGLAEKVNKLDWAKAYIEVVSTFCAAIKPNIQYWKNFGDMTSLGLIVQMAHEKGMVVIDDSKLADIGSTNDAGVYYSREKEYDAVTFSPFAGNMQEAVQQAHKRGLGLIPMCLMSNPEYEKEKNKLVRTQEGDNYRSKDLIWVVNDKHISISHVKQYIQLAHDAQKFGADALVIGAPSSKNHISNYEIENISHYAGEDMLVLLPGVGAQGGEAEAIWRCFGKNNVIVNVGRSLMFPNGKNSTPQDQFDMAKKYTVMLNELRKA